MKGLNGAGRRLLATIRDFTVAQRTLAVIGAGVLVLGGIALASVLSKPAYQPLFTGLSASDASGVVAQLNKDKVPYQLSDGGSTIEVPAANVDAERLAAASAGLPSNTDDSYALLDNLGVTASDFQQNVAYQRAISGEIAKSIESIGGVSNASVQLAIPQQTVFTSTAEDPTASVFVNASTPLTADQVQAIVHLTSAAVAGMKDADVTVVDQKGETLSADGNTGGSTSSIESSYEAKTKNAVQSMLDSLLGPGNSTVSVSADIDASSGTSKSTTYSTPAGNPTITESNNDSNYGAGTTGSGASGVLGSSTTTSSGTGGSGTFVQSQGSKQNALDTTVQERTIPAGTLKRQTIAIALNTAKVKGISATTIQGLVSAAAGIDPTRGDSVTVASMNFSTASAAAAKAALAQSQGAQQQAQLMGIVQNGVLVVGGIAGMIVFFVLVRKLFRKPEEEVDAGHLDVFPIQPAGEPMIAAPRTGGPLDAAAWNMQTAPLGSPAPVGPLPTATAAMTPSPSPTPAATQGEGASASFHDLQADVDALAEDPERAAEYLRALMGEPA